MQADYLTLADGTPDGAMSREDTERALSLLKNGQYLRIAASHGVNFDKPEAFVRALEGFSCAPSESDRRSEASRQPADETAPLPERHHR